MNRPLRPASLSPSRRPAPDGRTRGGVWRFVPASLFTPLGMRMDETQRMPARVAELVVEDEWRSERLIGWVQLGVITLFATLYFAAPRPTDAMDALFEPVPVVLEAYAIFTVLRLIGAYIRFLPGWLLVISMIADVVLLYALIFTFHIAYGQPPAFILKAPTFAYIFAFIVIRALRFDPRFVISQGLFAAIGWIAIVIYVVEDGGPEVITRSFTEYMTMNLVLIGAELDKIFTILLVTALLAMALYRARSILLDSVVDGAAKRDMRRFFGAGVAEAITSNEMTARAGDAVARDAAILMLDLRGFTNFSAHHPPEMVVATLTDYHRIVAPIIARHGGTIDKFLGDGVMATFGALEPSQTAAADATAALCEVIDATPQWQAALARQDLEALPINGAVVAGRVVAATLGDDQRLEFTVIGGAANLAARLEKHNKVTGTRALTDAATLEKARAAGFGGEASPLGEMTLAGGGRADLVRLR